MHLTSSELVLLATGGAILAPILATIVGVWGTLVQKAIDIAKTALLCKIELVDSSDSIMPILNYLSAQGNKISALSQETYVNYRIHLKVEGWRWIFFRRKEESAQLFLIKGRPIWYRPGSEGSNNNPKVKPSVAFIRGTFSWAKIARESAELAQQNYEFRISRSRPESNFYIRRFVGNQGLSFDAQKGSNNEPTSPSSGQATIALNEEPLGISLDDIGPPERDGSPLDQLCLTPEAEAIVKDVKFWYRHKSWYEERLIPWRRGYLLYGRPGTGKTSLIRALAEDLGIPVLVFNLASMSDSEFQSFWTTSKCSGPHLVLLEDFDRVFNKREPRAGVILTYDSILNALDGIERREGMLLFVTTNDIEAIDPALGLPGDNGVSTRPGRIDVTVDLPPLDYPSRYRLAMRITKDPEISEEFALSYTADTAAQFQDRCMVWAKKQLWS